MKTKKTLYTLKNMNTLLTTITIINAIGILVYKIMTLISEKDTAVFPVVLASLFIFAGDLIACHYGEADKEQKEKTSHWYGWIFELTIAAALPFALSYFLNIKETILLILFILELILHIVLTLTSIFYEFLLSGEDKSNNPMLKTGLPALLAIIPIVIEGIYFAGLLL